MIKDFQYYYNKNSFFYYIFLSIIIFIYLRNSGLINYDNIISIIITGFLMYLILSYHNSKKENSYQIMSSIYRNFDYDKYPNIKQDQEIIIILTSIKGLYDINPVEFRVLLRTINEFLYEYKRAFETNIYRDTSYSRIKNLATDILNILNSFSVNLKYKNLEINDLDIDTKLIQTSINSYPQDLLDMQNWLSKKLTSVESIINDKWLNGKININSSPIYPDDLDGIEYKSDNYNIY